MPQDLADTPGLGDAAHRSIGRLRLEDLADGSQSGVEQVRDEGIEQSAYRRTIAVEAPVRVEIRSQQPWPRHPHVIGRVAGALIALVGGQVARVVGAQRAQTIRCQESFRDDTENATMIETGEIGI